MATIELSLTELTDFMCWRMASADSVVALSTFAVAIRLDTDSKQDYTLIPGALDRMREAYKKRLDELKKIVDTPSEIG